MEVLSITKKKEDQGQMTQISKSYCADMKGSEIELRNSITSLSLDSNEKNFFFAVDTCDNFKAHTNNQNCKKNDEVYPMMKTLTLITRVS